MSLATNRSQKRKAQGRKSDESSSLTKRKHSPQQSDSDTDEPDDLDWEVEKITDSVFCPEVIHFQLLLPSNNILKDGRTYYQVRWKGYGPERDFFLSEEDLE